MNRGVGGGKGRKNTRYPLWKISLLRFCFLLQIKRRNIFTFSQRSNSNPRTHHYPSPPSPPSPKEKKSHPNNLLRPPPPPTFKTKLHHHLLHLLPAPLSLPLPFPPPKLSTSHLCFPAWAKPNKHYGFRPGAFRRGQNRTTTNGSQNAKIL